MASEQDASAVATRRRTPRQDVRPATLVALRFLSPAIRDPFMHHGVATASARAQAARILAEFSEGTASPPIGETILLRDGSYAGRRFTRAGWSVDWTLEDQTLRLFDAARCERRAEILVAIDDSSAEMRPSDVGAPSPSEETQLADDSPDAVVVRLERPAASIPISKRAA